MTQSKNAVSALELMRQLGVSYKTAWLMKHKLLQTMLVREELEVPVNTKWVAISF